MRTFKRHVATHRSGAETEPRDVAPTKCRCMVYIYDINSFLIHKYTTRQIIERTYEGLGGKRFVRLPENALVLNRWVRLVLSGAIKREQCMLCGHTHRDHLEFWSWLGRKKTKAFDEYVLDELVLRLLGVTSSQQKQLRPEGGNQNRKTLPMMQRSCGLLTFSSNCLSPMRGMTATVWTARFILSREPFASCAWETCFSLNKKVCASEYSILLKRDLIFTTSIRLPLRPLLPSFSAPPRASS